jgi:hypothetical protein
MGARKNDLCFFEQRLFKSDDVDLFLYGIESTDQVVAKSFRFMST